MRRKTIAVLGCGPAGLLAALAADQRGHTVQIFSKKVKSEMFGAQYLHESIPEITGMMPEFYVDLFKRGRSRQYAMNVYGRPDAPVSWDHFEAGRYPAWDLRKAYDRLWDRFEGRIQDVAIGPDDVFSCSEFGDLVFSTIPLRAICEDADHSFEAQKIWVSHGPGPSSDLISMMIYNGEMTPKWYRFSLINGYSAWEYREASMIPPDGREFPLEISRGVKPLRTNCNCHPDIIRLGRFGKWEKGVLTHHAYKEASRAL